MKISPVVLIVISIAAATAFLVTPSRILPLKIVYDFSSKAIGSATNLSETGLAILAIN